MKKIVTIAMIACVPLFMVSCKKDNNAASPKGSVEVKDSDADNIIKFNNNFLASYKSKTDRIKRILKYSDDALRKISGETVYTMSMVMPEVGSFSKKIDKVPSGFGSAQSDIEKSFKDYTDSDQGISAKYDELKSYMSAEDFKDDKGEKAKKIQAEMEALSKTFVGAAENILKKMKPAADSAEEIILKDHPLKKYILSSKAILANVDDSYDLFDKQYTDGKYDDVAMQKAYDAISKGLEDNQKTKFETSDSSMKYRGTSYDSYNKSVSDYLDTMRKVMRNAKESGKISDNDIDSIDSSYDSVVSRYNTFVD